MVSPFLSIMRFWQIIMVYLVIIQIIWYVYQQCTWNQSGFMGFETDAQPSYLKKEKKKLIKSVGTIHTTFCFNRICFELGFNNFVLLETC